MGRTVRSALLALLLPAAVAAAAVEVGGTKLDDSATVAGHELQLNGAGLRSIFIVKSYVAALYVSQRSRDPGTLLAQTGPRRLAMRMLSDSSAQRLGRAILEGLRNNHDDDELAEMQSQIAALMPALREVGAARKGDLITFDVADGAIQVAVNGDPKGDPIPNEAFYGALLRVFLGERPVDADLKKGLLGG